MYDRRAALGRRLAGVLGLLVMVNLCYFLCGDLFTRFSQRSLNQNVDDISSYYRNGIFKSKDLNGATVLSLPYLFFSPPELAQQTKQRYPLVILLHGSGSRGNSLRKTLGFAGTFLVEDDWQSRHPCFVVAPQCPNNHTWIDNENKGRVRHAIAQLVHDIKLQAAVDHNRVYLAGFSMGGHGCWQIAAESPNEFAAILPVAGIGDTRMAKNLKGVPCWAVHGGLDKAVPPQGSINMVRALQAQGGTARLTLLPNVSHNSWSEIKLDRDVYFEWLFSHTRQ